MPSVSQPRIVAALATARMTVFKPGQSPPPVAIPIFFAIKYSTMTMKKFCAGFGTSETMLVVVVSRHIRLHHESGIRWRDLVDESSLVFQAFDFRNGGKQHAILRPA